MSDWRQIRTDPPEVGETVILGNENTGDSFPGYSYWGAAPFPLWCSLHAEGMGRCRPTHWQPMPKISAVKQRAEAA